MRNEWTDNELRMLFELAQKAIELQDYDFASDCLKRIIFRADSFRQEEASLSEEEIKRIMIEVQENYL